MMLPEEVLSRRKEKVHQKRGWCIAGVCLILAVLIVYLLAGVFWGIAFVHGNSMSPIYRDGDLILYNRIDDSYHLGDVVLFRTEDDQFLLKRIIGMPGEELDIEGGTGTVLINALPLDETYVYEFTEKKNILPYPVDVGNSEYFVMGDHRGNSYDSRDFGTIHEDQIRGKAIAVFHL